MKHYYLVGQDKHTSALDAWQAISRNPTTSFSLVLDNDRFQDYDWTIPVDDIAFHEEQRAKQLIEKYPKIRLMYSGGSDSYSIAHTFLRLGRPVDEYLIYEWSYMLESGFDSSAYTEKKQEWLTSLHESFGMPKPNITVLKVDSTHLDHYFRQGWYSRIFGHGGTQSYSVNSLGIMSEFTTKIDDSYVNVLGMEKPRLFVDDKGVFWQMNDKNTLYGYTDQYEVEWFYLSADYCHLVNAQCRGSLRMARGLFPDIPLKDALNKLQTEDEFYHLWCVSVGRQTSEWQNKLSKGCKNIGISSAEATGKYKHIAEASSNTPNSWKHYNDYLNKLEDATKMKNPHGILSMKHYVELFNN